MVLLLVLIPVAVVIDGVDKESSRTRWLCFRCLCWTPSAPAPTAVLSLPVVFAWSAKVACGRVEAAAGVDSGRALYRRWPCWNCRRGCYSAQKRRIALLLMPSRVIEKCGRSVGRVLCEPMVFSKSAAAPVAVFESAVLSASVPAPTPVLKLPVVTFKSEDQPSPVLAAPLVRFLRAFVPSAVVKLG